MSLDKAIKHGKEKRRPYRNHLAGCGNCSWCIENRLHSTRKRMVAIKERLDELNEDSLTVIK